MKCFIFSSGQDTDFSRVCGVDTLQDLVQHLLRSGIKEIHSDFPGDLEFATVSKFNSIRPILGTDWFAAYHMGLSRQNPLELREKGKNFGAPLALSLACTAKPWENTTVFTGPGGVIQSAETNPPPENSGTNLCFSGLVWVGTEDFQPLEPWNNPGSSAFLLPGYWKKISGKDDFLTAFYDVLTGQVEPWPLSSVAGNGWFAESPVPDSCLCHGVLWLGKNCSIGEGCELENCVILNGSRIGQGAKLRNCLVLEGSKVAPGTVRDDKYLTMLGEING